MDILTVTRSCAATVLDATEQQISDVVANLPRLETVATAGVVVVTARSEDGAEWCPFVKDPTRDVMLTGKWTEGSAIYHLYARSAVDAEGTLLVNILAATVGQPGYDAVIHDFFAEDDLPKYIRDCVCLADGAYLLALGRDDGYDGTKNIAAVFRSTTGGAGGTWTKVLVSKNGGPSSMQTLSVSGQSIVFGSYHAPPVANTSVWLSEDGGATWPEIWHQTSIAEHVHRVIFDPVLTTRLWMTIDAAGAKLARLDLSGGVWTYTDVIDALADHDTDWIEYGCSSPFALGDKIILPWYQTTRTYDPATGYLCNQLLIPVRIEGANSAYGYRSHRHSIPPVKLAVISGVFYAPVRNLGATYAEGWDVGLWASPDNGEHWVRVYWPGTTGGPTHLVEWRGLIFAGMQSPGFLGSMVSFSPPHVALVQALRLEAGVTNVIAGGVGGTGLDASTFANVASPPHKSTKIESGWVTGGGSSATFGDSDILGDGATPVGNYGMFAAQCTIHPTLNTYNYGGRKSAAFAATSGQYVTASVWIKAVPPWPRNRQILFQFLDDGGTMSTTTRYSDWTRPSPDEWEEYRIEGKCTVTGNIRLDISVMSNWTISCTFNAGIVTPASDVWVNGSCVTFRNSGGALPTGLTRGVNYWIGDWSGTTFKIYSHPDLAPAHLVTPSDNGTGTQYLWSLDPWTFQWDAAMVVLDANNWYAGSFQPGGTARTAEYADATLTGLPAAGWSVGIEWRPGSGWKEYGADLGILSVGDGTHWMDLTWDASEAKFLLTDDGGQSGSQAAAMKWRHFDDLRLILTSDGTDTWLYVRDPANGIQAALKCTAVNIGKPSTLRIGANHDASLGAAGRFFNVWKEARKWSATEVANEAPYPGATVADGVYDYTPRGAAELLGVGR